MPATSKIWTTKKAFSLRRRCPAGADEVEKKKIVDFYIAKNKLVIELDGSQHYEEKGIIEDQKRDAYLRDQGLTILRYSNLEINRKFSSVCEDILKHL